jgi:hypothetical protein
MLPDSGVFPDRVGNQITAAAAPSVGGQLCYVMADGGSDEGFQDSFAIPKNYVGSPKIVVRGILDGVPGASDTLGFGFRKRAVANNEAADGTYDAEQTVSSTIGSSGSNHSDEDEIELSITLTAGDYSVDDTVYYYFYIDASGGTYAGNFLLTGLFFEYADA